MAQILARYAGKCGCGAAVAAGSKIEWTGRIAGCAACGMGKTARSAAVSGTIVTVSRPAYYRASAAPVSAGGRRCTGRSNCACYDCE